MKNESSFDEKVWLEHLASVDNQVRLNAIRQLLEFYNEKIDGLLLLLANDNSNVIRSSIALATSRQFNKKRLEVWIQLISDRDELVRQNGIRGLRESLNEFFKYLTIHTANPNPLIRSSIFRVLGLFGSPLVVGVLKTALIDENPIVRASVARSLGELKASEAAEILLDRLRDDDSIVRATAIEALGYIKDVRATEPLINGLNQEPNSLVRDAIIHALGELGDVRAVTPLLNLLMSDHETENTYDLVAMNLTFLGDDGTEALRYASIKGNNFVREIAGMYLKNSPNQQ